MENTNFAAEFEGTEALAAEQVATDAPETVKAPKERETYELADGSIGSRAAFIREKFIDENMSRKQIAEEFGFDYRAVYSATVNMQNEAEGSSRGRSAVNAIIKVNADNQMVATIVEEDVAFGPENLGVDPKEIRKRVDESLERVGMSEYKRYAPHLLSGGQKQRVAIAGILAMQPECIIFDEPTAMLDPIGRKDVLKTIKEINKEYGITIVLITHYMDEAAQADRIVVMDKGKLIMEGTPKKVFSQVELMKKIGLDVPQVTELSYELNKEGIKLDKEIINVDEMVEALCQLK